MQQSPSSQLGTRVPAQDYEKLRRAVYSQGDPVRGPVLPSQRLFPLLHPEATLQTTVEATWS